MASAATTSARPEAQSEGHWAPGRHTDCGAQAFCACCKREAGRFRWWAMSKVCPGTTTVLLTLLSLAVGCDSKDAAKCDEALRVTRQAAGIGDFTSAQKWREYAYKHC